MKKQCVAGLTQFQNRYPLAQRIVALPYGIATPRCRVAAPVPQRFWFTGRHSPQDHRWHPVQGGLDTSPPYP